MQQQPARSEGNLVLAVQQSLTPAASRCNVALSRQHLLLPGPQTPDSQSVRHPTKERDSASSIGDPSPNFVSNQCELCYDILLLPCQAISLPQQAGIGMTDGLLGSFASSAGK
jgi:hypothetical protein